MALYFALNKNIKWKLYILDKKILNKNNNWKQYIKILNSMHEIKNSKYYIIIIIPYILDII